MSFVLGCEPAAEAPPRPEPAQPLPSALPAPDPDRPNLVMVSIDTLRADHVGAYGYDRATSPRLDRLAAEGVLFENAFSHSSKTAPSHMTLMTSVYPEAHRVLNPFMASATDRITELGPGIPLLAEILHAAGYATAARTAGGNLDGALGFSRGFDSYSDSPDPGAEALFGAAMKRLDELAKADTPFFLFVHTYEVHAPYLPPARYADLFTDPGYAGNVVSDAAALQAEANGRYYEVHKAFMDRVDPSDPADIQHLRDLYDACIRYTDDQLGALLDRIDALGLAEDTLVVVLSDHGEEFQEHGRFEHNGLWDELLRVPLVFRVPESVRSGWRGNRVSAPVGLVDVLPTLLELLDLPLPSHAQGRSLVGLLEDPTAGRPWIFAQNREDGSIALREGTWKLVRVREGDPAMLFELGKDAAERHDLATIRPDRQRAALRRLREVTVESRGIWSRMGESALVAPSPDMQEQLQALGYLDAADAAASPP